MISEIDWAQAHEANTTPSLMHVLGCLQLGYKVQKIRRSNISASKHVDYTLVFRLIESFPKPQRAVGHYLYGSGSTEQANAWLDDASETIEQRLYLNHPNFKRWPKAKKAKIWFVIQTALMAYRQYELAPPPNGLHNRFVSMSLSISVSV